MLKLAVFAMTSTALAATCPPQGFDSIQSFDLAMFASKPWYIQQQAVTTYLPKDENYCVSAEYSVLKKETLLGYDIKVHNLAYEQNGKIHDSGDVIYAKIVDAKTGKLEVAPYFLPTSLSGDYWVIDYDESVGYALVSGGAPKIDGVGALCRTGTGVNGAGLWIFTRQQTRNEDLVQKVRTIAEKKGFDLTVLNDVDQSNCPPLPGYNTVLPVWGAVPIATFDGTGATTLEWQTVNDPVMGGKSKSVFSVDGVRRLGVWTGDVAIVPFLKAPGFCNLQSPGLGKTAVFPDLSSTDGMVVRARETNASGLKHFSVMLMSTGAKRFFQKGVYMANFTVDTNMDDHFVPWTAFKCSWRGQAVSWCPKLTTQLAKVNSVGLGTAFPGSTGAFTIEFESLSAKSSSGVDLVVDDTSYINLATFDGTATHKWHSENDPVMGGKSSSSVEALQSYAVFKGTTRIVPQLKAPGFTIAMTEGFPWLSKFPDVSAMDGLTVSVRSVGAHFSGYKVAFCDSHINPYRCQFQTFKADLVVPAQGNGDFQDVFIPWAKFSDKWNAATGKHTAENPPTASSLKSITQLQLWTEGVEGDFDLQFQYVRASKAPAGVLLV